MFNFEGFPHKWFVVVRWQQDKNGEEAKENIEGKFGLLPGKVEDEKDI